MITAPLAHRSMVALSPYAGPEASELIEFSN